MGLLSFLFGRGAGSRDGATPESAIIVASIPEEYQWVQRHCPGFQFQGQSLQTINGKRYDVLTLRYQRGEERQVYFDISQFFGS